MKHLYNPIELLEMLINDMENIRIKPVEEALKTPADIGFYAYSCICGNQLIFSQVYGIRKTKGNNLVIPLCKGCNEKHRKGKLREDA